MEARRIKLTPEIYGEITEAAPEPVFCDVLLENRQNYGIVYLGLGSVTVDGTENSPQVETVSRLRMSVVFAQGLRDALSDLIEQALKPADTSKAN